jgi:hypothetical protein
MPRLNSRCHSSPGRSVWRADEAAATERAGGLHDLRHRRRVDSHTSCSVRPIRRSVLDGDCVSCPCKLAVTAAAAARQSFTFQTSAEFMALADRCARKRLGSRVACEPPIGRHVRKSRRCHWSVRRRREESRVGRLAGEPATATRLRMSFAPDMRGACGQCVRSACGRTARTRGHRLPATGFPDVSREAGPRRALLSPERARQATRS